MNRNVAPSALAAGLESEPPMWGLGQQVKAGMALQAKLTSFTSHQQHAVRRAVWGVASGATLDLRSRVLVEVRAALFHMALRAGICMSLHKARWIQRAVGAMAIRAFDEPFGNTVMHRLSKLCADRGVTRVAKVRLRRLQKAAVEPARFVGALRYLKKLSLGSLGRALALVFDSIHEVDRVTLTAGDSGLKVTGVKERVLLLAALVACQTAF